MKRKIRHEQCGDRRRLSASLSTSAKRVGSQSKINLEEPDPRRRTQHQRENSTSRDSSSAPPRGDVNQVPPVCEKALEIPPKIGAETKQIFGQKKSAHTQIEFECLHGFLAACKFRAYLASTQWAHLIIISWLVYCYISVNKELLRRRRRRAARAVRSAF